MDNEWVPGWALFCGKDCCDGVWIQRIGSEAVDGLCCKGDEAAGAKEFCGVGDVCGVGGVEVESLHQGLGPRAEGLENKNNFIVAKCQISGVMCRLYWAHAGYRD